MEGQLVKTITADGLGLAGFWMKGKGNIALLHIHGTAGDFYTHKFVELEGLALVKKGVSFLTVNTRGHGVYADIRKHEGKETKWVSGGGGFEKFEDSLFDIAAWVQFLQKQGIKKIILQGHSLGPQKILYYQFMKKNPLIVGQIYLSPCNDAGLALMKHGEENYKKINLQIKQLIKDGKGNELLPAELSIVCPMSAVAYSGYLIEDGTGTLNPYHNPQSKNWGMFRQINEPLLIVLGEKDIYINGSCKENSSQYIVSLLKEKTKLVKNATIKVIKDGNHSYVGTEAQLVKTVIDWLKKNHTI